MGEPEPPEPSETPDRPRYASDDETLPLPGYASPTDVRIPDEIGPYPVTGILGHGGMGVVYAARDPKLERDVAIKVLPERFANDAELITRFRHEAQLLASLNHPNIATIYSLEETSAFHYLTMELVKGETLSEHLLNGALPVADTLMIARQVARGLEAAHQESIVHRDLKPPNIMLTPQGRVKLLDFGLARAVLGSEGSAVPISGTPGYMSPEQARGEPEGARADLWALGCVIYECLTGKRLVGGDTPSERIARTLDLEIDWSALPDSMPAVLRRLLERCLSTSDNRLDDVSVLRHELEEEVARRRVSVVDASRRNAPTPTSLPSQLSSFIGRDLELKEIERLITDHRLVTLTGFGGSGKTRLAVEVASRLQDRFPDGRWFVDLSGVAVSDTVLDVIARTVGLKEQRGRTLDEVLVESLRSRRALVVLDNCEHLLASCASVAAQLLEAATALTLLATSREPLRVSGEVVYRVSAMPVPDPADDASIAALERIDAVRLFMDRAKAATANFSLTEANAPSVATICRRMEGIPLGIELAAAKVRALSVAEIVERLDSSFEILDAGGATGTARHETLYSLIDWSHGLLSVEERVVFRRLAVFTGGWRRSTRQRPSAPAIPSRRGT